MCPLHFVTDMTPNALELYKVLSRRAPEAPLEEAQIIVVLGGDGFMLKTLHRFMQMGNVDRYQFYGINCGTVGFLMNPQTTDIQESLRQAQAHQIVPLKMNVKNKAGTFTCHAINEVYLFRQTHETAKIRILIDGVERLPELMADGILLSTPAGSTAYNLSAGGPVIPLGSNLLALTPLNPFRPRRWRGALIPTRTEVRFEILDAVKRPVSAVADYAEYQGAEVVIIKEDPIRTLCLLFDQDHNLEQRILQEQFRG